MTRFTNGRRYVSGGGASMIRECGDPIPLAMLDRVMQWLGYWEIAEDPLWRHGRMHYQVAVNHPLWKFGAIK